MSYCFVTLYMCPITLLNWKEALANHFLIWTGLGRLEAFLTISPTLGDCHYFLLGSSFLSSAITCPLSPSLCEKTERKKSQEHLLKRGKTYVLKAENKEKRAYIGFGIRNPYTRILALFSPPLVPLQNNPSLKILIRQPKRLKLVWHTLLQGEKNEVY